MFGIEGLCSFGGPVREGDNQKAPGFFERRFHGIRETASPSGRDQDPVDHRFDRVFFIAVKFDLFFQIVHIAVDADPHIPAFFKFFEKSLVGAGPPANQGGQDLDIFTVVCVKDFRDDLAGRLGLDLPVAGGTMGGAYSGEQEPKVIVNFRDRAHGGPGIMGGRPLFDRDGRRQPLNQIHVRFFHQFQKLSGVGREALHIPPLTLGVNRVKRQGTFPGPRKPRDNDHLVPRQIQGNVL